MNLRGDGHELVVTVSVRNKDESLWGEHQWPIRVRRVEFETDTVLITAMAVSIMECLINFA